MLEIFLTDDSGTDPEDDWKWVMGEIRIDDWRESFEAASAVWTPENYKTQWHSAVKRLVEEGRDSVLITAYVGPNPGGSLTWWPLYIDGNQVHVQNRILFFDQLVAPFDPSGPWDSLRARETISECGSPISEWSTDISGFKTFLQRLQREAEDV